MEIAREFTLSGTDSYRRILGIDFFYGSARQAVDRMRLGGLLVIPAAPALTDLTTNAPYREAILNADMAITDSAYMVLIWNLVERDHVSRLSGLEYLRELLLHRDVVQPGNTVWIMASKESARRNLDWLASQGVKVPDECVYVAPLYRGAIYDSELTAKLASLAPRHIIVTVGGGVQERLGLFIKRSLPYLPAIHCIGAAIAFLSGDQVHIPVWADKVYLGWLFRMVSDPRRYVPRYWRARLLLNILLKHRSELPPLLERRQA